MLLRQCLPFLLFSSGFSHLHRLFFWLLLDRRMMPGGILLVRWLLMHGTLLSLDLALFSLFLLPLHHCLLTLPIRLESFVLARIDTLSGFRRDQEILQGGVKARMKGIILGPMNTMQAPEGCTLPGLDIDIIERGVMGRIDGIVVRTIDKITFCRGQMHRVQGALDLTLEHV